MNPLKIKKVICDLDGVLLDYVAAYIKWIFPWDTPNQIQEKVSQVIKWDGLLEVTDTTFEDLKDIQNNSNFISTIQKYPYADKLVDHLNSKYKNITFLTAVTHHEREIMIENWWPDIPLFSGYKKEFWAESDYLLIDDSPKNCLKWTKAGGKFHLFPQPWNLNDPLHEFSVSIDW